MYHKYLDRKLFLQITYLLRIVTRELLYLSASSSTAALWYRSSGEIRRFL